MQDGDAAAEWKTFEEGLPRVVRESGNDSAVRRTDLTVFPHPAAERGLPDGWVIRWSGTYVGSDPKATHEAFVIERTGGGWTLVFHIVPGRDPKVPKTNLWDAMAFTVEGLYSAAVRATEWNETGPEADLRRFVLTEYDMGDPVEAAEATLVGLGARVTLFPRSLIPVTPATA